MSSPSSRRSCATPTMRTSAGWTSTGCGSRRASDSRRRTSRALATACQWMLEKGEPMLIADAGQDPQFPPEGIPLPGASSCLVLRRGAAGFKRRADDRHDGGAGAQAERVQAGTSDAAGDSGPAGGDAAGAVQPHPAAGTGAAAEAAHGARAGDRALFCGRYAGFDSGAGDGAGHGWTRGADELSLRATDGAEPGVLQWAGRLWRSFWRRTTASGRRANCARPRRGRYPGRTRRCGGQRAAERGA